MQGAKHPITPPQLIKPFPIQQHHLGKLYHFICWSNISLRPDEAALARRSANACHEIINVFTLFQQFQFYSRKTCHIYGHLTSLGYHKETSFFQALETKGAYVTSGSSICLCQVHMQPARRPVLVMILFACKSRSSTPKLIVRRFPHHLIW